MVLKLPRSEKRMFWGFKYDIVHLFANFLVVKLKPFTRKSRQSFQNILNLLLVIQNSFEATLRWKMNVLMVEKWQFRRFCKLLSDEVEAVLWESKAKGSKVLKSKVIHMKHFLKWFWNYNRVKSECSQCLKILFLIFFANFLVAKLQPFTGKSRQSF